MEARVFDEHFIYIQVLQDLLVLLDIRRHARPGRHVVRVVKTCFGEGTAIEVASLFDQIQCIGKRLVMISNVRIVVLEMDGKEHLPVVDGVHPTAIEELGVDAGFHGGDEEQRVNRVLLGDDVHKFDLRGTFAFNADPGYFDRRITVLASIDLRFDTGEDVILVDLLGLNWIVNKEKRQDGILTGFEGVCGVHFQKLLNMLSVLKSDG